MRTSALSFVSRCVLERVDHEHTARQDEQRICQLNHGKSPQILHVNDMAEYTQERELDGEAIDETEEDLEDDDRVYQALEKFLSNDGVFLDEF
jgi:hypothetical protein